MMKKIITLICALSAVFILAGCGRFTDLFGPGETWTVLMYLNGSDLESKFGAATYNLNEISQVKTRENVNFIIETGGTSTWHSDQLGVDIAEDKIQRYVYTDDGFQLLSEKKNANMAKAVTLSNFITWAAANYPADKYMLIMWGHGAATHGLLSDENYSSNTMSLSTWIKALTEAEVHFDLIMAEASMMANLETASRLAPFADYYLASEEVMPSQGTAYQDWVQYLYKNPKADGKELGTYIIEGMQEKYRNDNDLFNQELLTYSLIDLTKINEVKQAFDQMFTEIGGYINDRKKYGDIISAVSYSDQFCFGDAYYSMVDLLDFAYSAKSGGLSAETYTAVEEAVQSAVISSIHGSAHPDSHGLSFYYDGNANANALKQYAKVAVSAPYLAYLDALNDQWTASESIYEKTEPLSPINRNQYSYNYHYEIHSDGSVDLAVDNIYGISRVDYNLMRYDENIGGYEDLGISTAVTDNSNFKKFKANLDGTWPSIYGIPVYMNLTDSTEDLHKYNIPVHCPEMVERIGSADVSIRVFNASDQYGVYNALGFWDSSYASGNHMNGKTQLDASKVEGLHAYLRYHLYDSALNYTEDMLSDEFVFESSIPLTLAPLPEGQYIYSYVITDIFGQHIYTEWIPFSWNGESLIYN